ncbi:hypothetical protein JCM10450v2_001895 [Rhodotorula kratochvilovae]
MDEPYPAHPQGDPSAPPRRDSSPAPAHPQDAHQGSPPLVPVPHDQPAQPAPYPPSHPGSERPPYDHQQYGDYPPPRPPYDDRASSAASSAYYPRPEDPYRGHPPPPAHPGYRDPYGAPAYASHYAPRPPHGYGAYPPPHPRDPYGRDAYGRPAYGYPPPPPRDPYGAPPPSDYYGRPPPPPHDYYARPPPPPAAHSSYPPPSSRGSQEPTPTSFGPPPDPNDLTIPLLYLARSVSHKTFAPLKPQYHNLELRFINSLLDLSADLHTVSLEHPNLIAGRRRVWVTAVGGTDALVARVRANTETVLDWREVGDLAALERELGIEDRRVVTVRAERAEDARRAEREAAERREREREEYERERGRREIEDRERERLAAEGGVPATQLKSEPDELNEVLRAVRGEPDVQPNGHAHEPHEDLPMEHQQPRAEGPPEPAQERSEGLPRPASGAGLTPQSPGGRSSRKRSRRDEHDEAEDDKEQRRAERKKLEAVCKMPRRRCVDSSLQQGIPVNDETRAADDEPQLGERHKGIWDLFGQPLDDASPQIQVLMARALRDVTYPPRLRLYDHPEAAEQLEAAVPWFVTLLKTIKTRYELAAADPLAPLDPPLAGPFAAQLPDSSAAVPTLGTL